MAAHSGTTEMQTSRWYMWFSIFGKTDRYGKRIRGLIYCKHTQVYDCGHTMNFYEYVTKKDMFKLKLKGIV